MKTIGRNDARRAAALLLTLLLVAARELPAQSQAAPASGASPEPRALVDVSTAGMLRGGMTAFQADFFETDGINAGFAYGLTDRLMIGLSYGGLRMIGTGSPDWNEVPGFLARVRVIEESAGFPALALGFESQGSEGYIDSTDRFTVKSPGVYLVGSKNYDASGYLGFHGGVNYSFETGDGDRDFNLFFGLDKSLGSFLSLNAEYNFGWNDNSGRALGRRGRGYLNAGVSVFPGAGITLSLHFKDLFDNQPRPGFATRTLRVEFAR